MQVLMESCLRTDYKLTAFSSGFVSNFDYVFISSCRIIVLWIITSKPPRYSDEILF